MSEEKIDEIKIKPTITSKEELCSIDQSDSQKRPKSSSILYSQTSTNSSNATSSGTSSKSSNRPGSSMFCRRKIPHQNSTNSSSTDETEARERRFGSIDLHPLPSGNINIQQRQQIQQYAAAFVASKTQGESEGSSEQQPSGSGQERRFSNVCNNQFLEHLSDALSQLPFLRCPVHAKAFKDLGSQLAASSQKKNMAETLRENLLAVNALKKLQSSLDSNVQGQHRIGPYVLGPSLGRGNFAVVKLATYAQLKTKVAIKIMNKDMVGANNLHKVSRELEALKRCQHPHVCRLYQVMETESSIYMVMEYACKGEVFDHISLSHAFSEKEARELFWQIISAIDFCHNSGVVHRDLKAENLLLDANLNIKVADFGFCNFVAPDQLLTTHCGSPQYAAPELFKGEPYDGPLADVWSLGVILYILVCGSFPFPGESLGDIRTQVLRGIVRFPFFLSRQCEQLIRCMLQVDPARRFHLRQVIATPWMQASPNIDKYNALLAEFEAKAKEKRFEDLFHKQHPEHSEMAHADQIELEKQRIDMGVLKAVAIALKLDEDEIQKSVVRLKCDHLHAAYQLLKDKLSRFASNVQLRSHVLDAIKREQERYSTGGVHPVHESEKLPSELLLSCAAQKAEHERRNSLFASESCGVSPVITWESQTYVLIHCDGEQPKSTDLRVVLTVMNADEEELLRDESSAEMVQPPVNIVPTSVRRHTVQMNYPPIETEPKPPPVRRKNQSSGTNPAERLEAIEHRPVPSNSPSKTVARQPQRTAPFMPRQTTQPTFFGLQYHSSKTEQLLQDSIEWIPTPWSSSRSRGSSRVELNEQEPSRRQLLLPEQAISVESGEEEGPSGNPEDSPEITIDPGNLAVDDSLANSLFLKVSMWSQAQPYLQSLAANEASLKNKQATDQPACERSPPPELPPGGAQSDGETISATSATVGGPQSSSHGEAPANLYDDNFELLCDALPACYFLNESLDAQVGRFLPQLNLPANMPGLNNEPLNKCIVKDPHLLIPPEYLNTFSTTFPRRSSDGAAELQPLHRQAPMLGGSYPEQAQYRNVSSQACSTDSETPVPESGGDNSSRVLHLGAKKTLAPLKATMPSGAQAGPGHFSCQFGRALPGGYLGPDTEQSAKAIGKEFQEERQYVPSFHRPMIQQPASAKTKFASYQKRFSLPTGCKQDMFKSQETDSAACCCHKSVENADSASSVEDPLSLVVQLQYLVACGYLSPDILDLLGIPVKFNQSYSARPGGVNQLNQPLAAIQAQMNAYRRGSEASQRVQWSRRIKDAYQYLQTTIEEPTDTEPVQPMDHVFSGPGPSIERVLPTLCVAKENKRSVTRQDRHTTTSMDEEMDTSESLPASDPVSPVGIELGELKAELHNLDKGSEQRAVAMSRSSESMPNSVGALTPPAGNLRLNQSGSLLSQASLSKHKLLHQHHRKLINSSSLTGSPSGSGLGKSVPHRVASLKLRRSACMTVAGGLLSRNRSHSATSTCRPHARTSCDKDLGSDMDYECEDRAREQHRHVVPVNSNPEAQLHGGKRHCAYSASMTNSVSSIESSNSSGSNRSASADPQQIEEQPKDAHDDAMHLPCSSAASSRRNQFDYLCEATAASLEFLNSPKRKVCQDWLPKMSVLSKRAAACAQKAVASISPTTSMTNDKRPLPTAQASLTNQKAQAETSFFMGACPEQQESEQKTLHPLRMMRNSLLGGSITDADDAVVPHMEAAEEQPVWSEDEFAEQSDRLQMLPGSQRSQVHRNYMAWAKDDDADLEAIERVNQRLALTQMLQKIIINHQQQQQPDHPSPLEETATQPHTDHVEPVFVDPNLDLTFGATNSAFSQGFRFSMPTQLSPPTEETTIGDICQSPCNENEAADQNS